MTGVQTCALPICANCHKSTAQGGWPTNIKMDHSQLLGAGAGACATCHKTGGVGTAKPQVHMNTTLACDMCHDKTTTWAIRSITYTHQAGLTQGWFKHGALTSCIDCHASNGLVQWETGLYKKSCAGCHARQYQPENDHLPPITSIEANKHCGGTVPGGTGCHGRNRGF